MAAPVLGPHRYDTEDGLPDGKGCVALISAFWEQVHDDLRYTTNRDCLRTVRWVESADLEPFCAMAGTDAATVRASLAARYPRSFALYGRKAPDAPPDEPAAQ
jgi:hypothetical protein